MAKIGYARVSTRDQHPEQQKRALLAEGCAEDDIFTDHGASGAKASRPEWDRCLAHLRKGDVLVVTRIDRVGRSLINLLDVVNLLFERGVQLKVLDQPDLDTTSRNGRLVLQNQDRARAYGQARRKRPVCHPRGRDRRHQPGYSVPSRLGKPRGRVVT
jgi:DNA invertase Pin-like site-specific DNA recombinase